MKQIDRFWRTQLAALLLLALLTDAHVLAEDAISLRGGIHFGDSMETVARLETLPEDDSSTDEEKTYLRFHGSLAGGEALVVYRFDMPRDELYSVFYNYDVDTAGREVIHNDLVEQFGEPLERRQDAPATVSGSAKRHADSMIGWMRYNYGSGFITSLNEWIVEGDGWYIKVEEIAYTTISDYMLQRMDSLLVSYDRYTDQQWHDALAEAEAESASAK